MHLPAPVRRIIEERAERTGFAALKRAAVEMSGAYREGRSAALQGLPSADRTAAYLVTRMPATYAAASAVLQELRERLGGRPVGSILDVGAGTGAASLAAREAFPAAAITLLERDRGFAEAAREFLPDATLLARDIAGEPLPAHDLVIAAYSLGELRSPAARRLWQAARVALAIIEPGTPAGFALVRQVRDELLAGGAHMLAPCPGEGACPMTGGNWCHFAARVERSSLHRRLKEGQLNYEDEKFSYVALGREAGVLPEARILRHPRHQPGLIVLETCTAQGLATRRITKRHKEAFRTARHASWGDALTSETPPSSA